MRFTVRSNALLGISFLESPDAQQRREDATRLRRRPGGLAAMLKVIAWGQRLVERRAAMTVDDAAVLTAVRSNLS